jgi:hypothetical protein
MNGRSCASENRTIEERPLMRIHRKTWKIVWNAGSLILDVNGGGYAKQAVSSSRSSK